MSTDKKPNKVAAFGPMGATARGGGMDAVTVAQQRDHIVMFFLLGFVIHPLVFSIQEPPLSVDWRMNGLDSNKEGLYRLCNFQASTY